jgi:adenylate kinase
MNLFATVVVFLGPPGSGKGTQGKELAKNLRAVQHLATGDLFRSEIAQKTPIGQQVESVISSGKLVSDELTYEVLKSQLTKVVAEKQPLCLLLDGYPRNGVQVRNLVKLIEETKLKGPIFFELEVPKEVIVDRVSGRLVNPRTGAVYHLKTKAPRVAGRCDQDGGELIQRPDDRPEVVGGRYDIYQKGLAEMLAEIQKGGYPHLKFNGTGPVKAVSSAMEMKVKELTPGLTG